jgi:metallophosphoesterase superfamily enzyme
VGGELVVFPAFNDLSGGTWVNVTDREFLSPFLPEGLDEGQAYLLDGTRLGKYRCV